MLFFFYKMGFKITKMNASHFILVLLDTSNVWEVHFYGGGDVEGLLKMEGSNSFIKSDVI